MPDMEDVVVVETAPQIGPIIVAVVGVALAAVCIWLTVRFVNRRKKSHRALWAAAVVVVLAIYILTAPLSEMLVWGIVLGHWLGEGSPDVVVAVIRGFYFPVHWLRTSGPWPIQSVLEWYYDLWLHDYSL
jgi:hypothetical protein